MTFNKLTKGLLSATALTVLSAGTAFAAGTTAGTNVQNTFTLDYQVDGVDQTEINNNGTPTEFTVDRIIDLTVASNGDTTVQPNEENQELVFTVTNTGNDTQDFALTVADVAGGDFAPEIDGVALEVSLDGGTTRTVYDPANPPTLAADAVLTVYVIRDIPAGATDADQAEISLLAQVLDANTVNPATEDTDGNTLVGVAENVFADDVGPFDPNQTAGTSDGYHSDSGSFIVASANLDAAKTVSIFRENGLTGPGAADCANAAAAAPTTDQYSIPGACVEYRITANNTGGTAATSVNINDVLSGKPLTFVSATATGFTGGTFSTPALPAAAADCESVACVVNFEGATLAASGTGEVIIRALVK